MAQHQYYDVTEENDAFTTYQSAAIENCSSNFITLEELNAFPYRRCTESLQIDGEWHHRYIVVNDGWISSMVAVAKNAFDNRDPKRKTVPFELLYDDQAYLVEAFRRRLSDIGLKWMSGRIRATKPKPNFNKLSVITSAIDGGIHQLEQKFGLSMRIDRPSNDAKTRIVKFLDSNGISFDDVLKTTSSYCTYNFGLEGATEFARNWWKEQLEKELPSTEK